MYCKVSIIHTAPDFEPHAFRSLTSPDYNAIKANMAVWAT